jgi:GH15 family glucan-1,4-alpha-glucosidase
VTDPSTTYRQPPIRDYAAIGDCHGSALVSRHGSVDWCCLARFDADPVFCRMLDPERGGFLAIEWPDDVETSRRYLPGTNILESTFRLGAARVRTTDLMPVGRAPSSSVHDYVTLRAPHWLIRIVECDAGPVRFRLRYSPSQGYARRPARIWQDDHCLRSEGACLYSDAAFRVEGTNAAAECELSAGQRLLSVVTSKFAGPLDLAAAVERYLAVTAAFWTEWSGYCRYEGPYRDAVMRSALALKLLTYAPTGAIAAAPTTSLPEWIGGERNWDYRFCWPRDASFMLFALGSLGYEREGNRFADFLDEAFHATMPNVQIMYGIGQETQLVEHELEHLSGYRGSRPVRTGNGAYTQRQLDVYGEILDWADLHAVAQGGFRRHWHELFAAIEKLIDDHWHDGDQGIWEMRGPPRQHTFGKVMCWVGLDRLNRLLGKSQKRHKLQEKIRRMILSEGLDPTGSHLVGTFGLDTMNAALLLAPLVGFPLTEKMLRETIEAVQRHLQRGEFVLRYQEEDGVSGSEGAFLVCSFWLVDALLTIDRVGEARALFERLLARANDVGLLSEEVDPSSGELLGNFPQGLTHLALIQNAVNFQIHELHGAKAIRGAHSDRARHSVEAIRDVHRVWTLVKKSYRARRVRSSRASMIE